MYKLTKDLKAGEFLEVDLGNARNATTRKTAKYLSLFSGIGGFEKAIGDRAECIGYSEIDKYAIQVYEKYFNHKNYGDCAKIDSRELPDFDLLVGGFPCQAFSVAGKRRGFEDTRGTLFFEVARICKEKKPRYLLLENVRGLLSHDGGRTFQTMLGILADLGYSVEWQVLNSKDFGVPQNRERIFIVGYLGGFPRRKVFPVRESSEQTPRRTNDSKSYMIIDDYNSNIRQDDIVGSVTTNIGNKAIRNGTKIAIESLTDGYRIRRLTPVECERLQAFPDNWTKEGTNGLISDTQRYKMLGNAVTVNVVKAIISKLLGDNS